MTPTRTTSAALTAVVAGALLAGCGTADGVGAPVPEEQTQHGYVEGAEEAAEPQHRLVIADTRTGAVHVLDLITEEATEVDRIDGVGGVHGDGRFAYLTAEDGAAVHVVDSGAWTVDHGDHSHYYRAETRSVGTVEGNGLRGVGTDTAVTALSFADGRVSVLDRPALEEGDIAEAAALDGRDGAALPYAGHLLVPAVGDGGGGTAPVEALTRGGEPSAWIEEPCPDLQGQAVTRRGAVFGCSDGALLVTEDGDALRGERIDYPEEVPEDERAREFQHRPGGSTLAAKAGERGVWVLDTAAKEWTLLETGPAVAVNAVGEGAPVLVLTEDGTLRAFDPETGEQTAETELLDAPLTGSEAAPPVIRVDTGRAYVNDPAADAVHEVDYNDDLRIARTFDLGFTPDLMVETGR
ncbi:outer membrane protein assembly factor BamB/predicted small secreted protein [Spinactinospora alkalitolerans]|uniref:Outer membrane protein assembly factor BamB/predicted small secreted protein n=1 Tax=Spinactinospora alkalitolerans TaxID=687207 RepID=A0A852TNW4_9ACTN|nr:hypothetical protein [Spinactinospora alkalitolerans]NYE45669.1 outer membrane protein assembly factor BamB/predicted small secreted protein [Spinactinospora alkalitolerans]